MLIGHGRGGQRLDVGFREIIDNLDIRHFSTFESLIGVNSK